jgi:hypothetical protein
MSRKVLTLSERVEAIKLHDCGKSSQDVAQIMGVGRMSHSRAAKTGCLIKVTCNSRFTIFFKYYKYSGIKTFSLPIIADVAFIIVKNFTFSFTSLTV